MEGYERIDRCGEDTGWERSPNKKWHSIFSASLLVALGFVGYTWGSNDSEALTVSSDVGTAGLTSMQSLRKETFRSSTVSDVNMCSLCVDADDDACLLRLMAAFTKLEDADRLTLETKILKGKYSCGSSLSEDHCLSYLDEKFMVMSDTDKLDPMLEACNDGSLFLGESSNEEKVTSPSQKKDQVSSQNKAQTPTEGTMPPVAFTKMLTSTGYSCEACKNLEDKDCIVVLDRALSQMKGSERLSLELKMLENKYDCGSSVSDDMCLSYLDKAYSSINDEERLSLLVKSCYKGELKIVPPISGAENIAEVAATVAIPKVTETVEELASTHFHRSCNGGCSTEKVSLAEAKDEWMHRADVMEIAAQKVVYGNLTSDEIRGLFTKFQEEFDRSYDEKEEVLRFDIFKNNLKFIDALNRQNPLAVFGITECSDHTEAERSKRKMSQRWSDYDAMKASLPTEVVEAAAAGPRHVVGKTFDVSPHLWERGMVSWASEDDCAACEMFPGLGQYNTSFLPEQFDWRKLGAVSSVKNQKYCGSCWSFAAVQDIEGVHFLATGNLTSFSEQQLIACDERNYGCDGGWMYAAMQYIADFGGIVPDYDYPYKGIYMNYEEPTPTCDQDLLNRKLEENGRDLGHISGFQMVAMGGEYERLMETVLLKNGPLSLAVNANGIEYYVRGIIGCETIAGKDYCNSATIDNHTPCDPTALDHGVLAIGFGEQENTEYWTIKNSWGEQWGEDGFYRLERGNNKCGVANMVQHSVFKKMEAKL